MDNRTLCRYTEPFMYTSAFEAFMTSQSHAFTPTGGSLGSKNGLGVSVFGSYNLIPELAAVVRMIIMTRTPTARRMQKAISAIYVIAGLSWKVW